MMNYAVDVDELLAYARKHQNEGAHDTLWSKEPIYG